MLHQREQLNNIETKTGKINQDLKVSQKHITNIKSIFGGIKNWWNGDKEGKEGASSTTSRPGRLEQTLEQQSSSRPHPGERLRQDDGRGFYEEEEEDLDTRFMKGARNQQAKQYFTPVTKSRREERVNENLGRFTLYVWSDSIVFLCCSIF